ncbi:Uncharacterized protein PBTT_03183 [Plasmodiophora brassicae]
MASTTKPWSYACESASTISSVEMCPFPFAASYLAIGAESVLTVATVDDVQRGEVRVVREARHGHCYVPSVSWHPESIPGNLTLGMVTPDCSVTVYRFVDGNGEERTASRKYEPHRDLINACVLTESSVITAADDALVCLTDIESCQSGTLQTLQSSGVAVRTSTRLPHVVFIAELNGAMRLVDPRSTPDADSLIRRFTSLVVDADFHFPYIATVSTDRLSLFDCRFAASPVRQEQAPLSPFDRVRFSISSPAVLATTMGRDIQVWDVTTEEKRAVTQEMGATGMSWHGTAPVCVTGGDHVVHAWPFPQTKTGALAA